MTTFSSPEQSDFVLQEYLPLLVEAMKDVTVNVVDWIIAVRLFTGAVMKLLYAFVFQE